jgi:hypothetical protein
MIRSSPLCWDTSPGPDSLGSFSLFLKISLTVLKIQNRWLQWLQNVQKPLAGLFRHLVWPTNEEVTPPGSFSLQACCLCLPKRTCE